MDWILHCIEQFANWQVIDRIGWIVLAIVIVALAAWLFFRGIETT
jgi:hypothetical protein